MMRRRWHGTPGEPQPDVGDVLYVAEWHDRIGDIPAGPILCGQIYRVHHAREVTRGPNAHKPHELVVTLEPESVRALGEPDTTYWPIRLDRGDRP